MHFPDGISKDIENYAIEEVLKFSRYIFTQTIARQQYGYCTHCNTEFRTYGLKHNQNAVCPNCGSNCITKQNGRGRKSLQDIGYFVYYEKSTFERDVIIARGFLTKRDYRDNYKNVNTIITPVAWYIFKMGKSIMLQEGNYWRNEQYSKCASVFSNFTRSGYTRLILKYSRDSIKKAVKNTPFQYSTWEQYDIKDMTEFFNLYSKSPSIEYLTKEGFKNLVVSKLNGDYTHRAVNWKGKNIFKILKVNKLELREIKKQKIRVTFEFLDIFHDAKKHNWNLTCQEIVEIANDYIYDYDTFMKMAEIVSPRKLLKYLSKQYDQFNGSKNNRHYYDHGGILTNYRDYIADCEKLNRNIKLEQTLFPKDLYTAHQNTTKQIKIKENEKLDTLIKQRVKELEKYTFQYGDYLIRPAMSTAELIEEGSKLNHCVATHYTEPYAKGTTNILFVRRISNPEIPFCTVEVKNNLVKQAYIKDDKIPDKQTLEFIEVFKSEKLQSKKKNKIPA